MTLIFFTVKQLGAFAAGVKQMLEDVQERLVYRTHIYIQTDILGYKPAPGDLAYPAKLEMMEVRVWQRKTKRCLDRRRPLRMTSMVDTGSLTDNVRTFKIKIIVILRSQTLPCSP